MIDKKYQDILDTLVERKAAFVCEGGTIRGGWNGPYYDYEMPIRNISHWACTFAAYYKMTGKALYLDAVRRLSEHYLDEEILKDGQACLCRVKCGKDRTNGVMGPAWVIEGLLACAETLGDRRFYEKSVALFCTQRFDEKYGLWSVIETDGRDMGFDITFNHQLWYAAAGSMILDIEYDERIDRQIRCFLDHAQEFFLVHENGLIFHYIKHVHSFKSWKWFRKTYKNACRGLAHTQPSLAYKEEGYHTFSMYAFALMYHRYREHPFFAMEKVKKAIAYTFREDALARLSDTSAKLDSTHIGKKNDPSINVYAYPYNSPAFELPYIAQVFKPDYSEKIINRLLEEQFRWTYDEETMLFSRNTEDKETLTARIYELVRAFPACGGTANE